MSLSKAVQVFLIGTFFFSRKCEQRTEWLPTCKKKNLLENDKNNSISFSHVDYHPFNDNCSFIMT